jgi:hypothetical protein
MPNYTYSAYMSQSTPALRLAMARLFHSEITDQILADLTAGGGKSRTNTPLNALMERVTADIAALERQAGDQGGPRVVYSDVR